MKNEIYILFLVFCQVMTSQTNESEEIFWDLISYKINPENYSDIGYLDKVDPKTLKFHLTKIKNETSLKYYDNKTEKNDSIILSLNEKEYLISELTKSKEYSWNISNKEKLIKVKQKNILKFLQNDKNRELKIISKPVFIRNGNIACVFSAHICCGHINGYVNISLYKKKNKKWETWITLSEGAF
ncbi:hypothetical protein [Mesonia mobilis]|uniref:Uncharacterized protein n=1 Tax=Mesonia mobilis TaxID=369791 RepID=A0ABQ3C4Q3_9FLAO|nr:hypothetical protein [Mesonia mobilis]MBQ0739692.1 hypothetical protein [Aquimarina celericrescens]GGZ66594.1 hypothetical protein GCM10008088_29060 [Mesonia mobilis]